MKLFTVVLAVLVSLCVALAAPGEAWAGDRPSKRQKNEEKGVREHDGGYLGLRLGAANTAMDVDDVYYAGYGAEYGFKLGLTLPTPAPVVVGISGDYTWVYKRRESSMELSSMGLFLEAYPSIESGWHFGASAGSVALNFDDYSVDPEGASAYSLWVGHTWWVGPQHSLGPTFTYTTTDLGGIGRLNSVKASLLFTYN